MPTARLRAGSALRNLLLTGLAFGVATAGLAGTAAARPEPKPMTPPSASSGTDTHPADQGWQQIDGTWVQLGATHPHAMPNATTFARQQAAKAHGGGGTGPQNATADGGSGRAVPHNNYDLQMTYRGGQDSIGVTTGRPRVYLIYWGSQWGTPGTDPATGDVTLSGDPDRAAPYQQEFFKGLGSSTDTWSKVMTQYCEGIAPGSDYCPADANHVGMPAAGQTLAGVWVDNSAPSPQAATEPQIAAEALAASRHFGNTDPNQNRDVQYVINTPQGEDSDKWKELGYCAWHTFMRSPAGTLAYTLMPYLTDVGPCGTNWINPGPRGRLDGYGIIGGHEYAETITDQNASGAWTDATGQEIGDKCSWIPVGSNGGMFNLQLSTGSFPVQTMWSNYDHLCTGDGPLFANAPLLVTQPCEQTVPSGGPVDIPVLASDSAGRPITYSARGLPAGLRIDAATGHITGTTHATGWRSITVTGRDDRGNTQSRTFRAGFFAGPQLGCSAIEQLTDPGFENGTADHGAWNPSGYNVVTPSSAHRPHSGTGYAWLGQSTANDDSITQWVETTPGYSKEYLSFWLDITGSAQGASAPAGTPVDTLSLELYDQWSGNHLATVRTWSNLDATDGYRLQRFDLTPYVAPEFGSTVGIKLVAHSTSGRTAFLIDDASVKLY
ncbi:Ig domain-containing protein [Kitasatospora sp. HPMI-4]|uniref:Ig domain-containing protein n=1 Tax=Kitasatospora sp. HPMI-4 TaxID=3448443 RepID=UPI003F1D6274